MPYRLVNLKAQRELAGLTVSQLAFRANSSDREIQGLESPHPIMAGKTSGVCNNEVAQRIADVLGVSLATLGQELL